MNESRYDGPVVPIESVPDLIVTLLNEREYPYVAFDGTSRRQFIQRVREELAKMAQDEVAPSEKLPRWKQRMVQLCDNEACQMPATLMIDGIPVCNECAAILDGDRYNHE